MIKIKKSIFFGCLAIAMCLATAAFNQELPAGPQVLTFFSDVDDTEQPYGLYLPENYDANKKYPLVVMLHGAGSNHRLALRRVFGKSNLENENDVEASSYFPEWPAVEYIVISPYARGTAGYQGVPEKDVYDALEDAKKRFSVDEDRVYLTGLSMGGGGTLWLGLTRPDVWAAIAPVCPAPPKGAELLAKNASNLPVHLFHGDADPVVPVKISRDFVEAFENTGTKVAYAEYPGVQHDSWVQAYDNGFVFDWFKDFRRNLFPDEVNFATRNYKYNKAYWVEISALTPGTLASLTAKFTQTNKISVETENLDAFTLHLDGHPQFDSSKKPAVTIDGKKIKADANTTLSFYKTKNKWTAGAPQTASGTKQKGAEGPISEAFASRHVYVYGTLDNPSQEVLAERIKLANEAANWSVYRGPFLRRYMVFPRVVSDKELRQSDLENANLILLGTRETNAVIAENGEVLPLHLKGGTDQYGLFYVYPLNGKYVAVSSGIPWWKKATTSGFNFLPANLAGLAEFKNFILFENAVDNKISEGFFTNQWNVPDAEAEKLKASGVISVKE